MERYLEGLGVWLEVGLGPVLLCEETWSEELDKPVLGLGERVLSIEEWERSEAAALDEFLRPLPSPFLTS